MKTYLTFALAVTFLKHGAILKDIKIEMANRKQLHALYFTKTCQSILSVAKLYPLGATFL